MVEIGSRIYVKTLAFLEQHAGIFLFVLGCLLLNGALAEFTLAQTGGGIFRDAATTLACKVLPGKFGTMLSAFAGIFALIAAATGAYRAVWGLLFVSAGCYIANEFIAILFGDTVKC